MCISHGVGLPRLSAGGPQGGDRSRSFDIIAGAGEDAGLSPFQVASDLPKFNPNAPAMIDRILRLLASFNVLTCKVVTRENGQVERLYGLTPTSRLLVKNLDGASVAPLLLLIQDKVFSESW